MTTAPLRRADFPAAPGANPAAVVEAGRYRLRFARSEAELDRILALRYEVFNLELGEGLAGSHATGRDEDRFDRVFHHLLIEERGSGTIVGTYRMQTAEMAKSAGYYCQDLFELHTLPDLTLRRAVEIGRACVARPHRNGRVLQLLWRGLASYLTWNRKSVLFGCCSLTSQDEAAGLALHRELVHRGAQHPSLTVLPQAARRCAPAEGSRAVAPKVPALFQAYLALGAKVLGPPAIDREFQTIDWLVLLDIQALDPATHRTFFA